MIGRRSPRLVPTRPQRGIRRASFLVACVLLASACTGEPGTGGTPRAGAVRVVATTTVLADLVGRVAGQHADVTSLVPAGGEVHTFDPSPGDVASLASADLVVMNGLGLDEWVIDLIEGSGTKAAVIELGEDLDGVEYLESGGHDGEDRAEESTDHAGEGVNPHVWLNVEYGSRYVDRIEEALVAADPVNPEAYGPNAERYRAELAALHEEIASRMAAIPAQHRRIVSFHEAFPYFARAYGLEIIGVVVSAPGQDPSAAQIAALVSAIRESGARAVFGEAQFDPHLARAIAEDAGVPVETGLHNDSLGEPPADSYVGMMRDNADRIEAALR